MKLSLIDTNQVPPNGFRYVDPVDGWVDQAWDYQSWVQQQKNHIRANGRELPLDLEGDMQHQLCQTLEPGWCNWDSDSRPRVSTSLGWGDVMNGLQTFTNWIGSGMAYVSQGEADRRAEICAKCVYNVHVSGCSVCQKLVEEVVKNKRSKYDSYLKACAICRCFLRAKIHFKINTLAKDIERHQDLYSQVDHCWLNKNGDNFKPD